jgi:hypothetical protein
MRIKMRPSKSWAPFVSQFRFKRHIPNGLGTLLVVAAIFLGSFTCWFTESHAAGPWKAQILDAETKKAIEGVVVVAAWFRRYTSVGGWAGGGYYDSEEVVTGSDGQFVIQSRRIFSLNPFSSIQGPQFYIYKAGYGLWRFQGQDAWPNDAYEQGELAKKAWDQFTGSGVVIELPPLKTMKERVDYVSKASASPEIPSSAIPQYRKELDREFLALGFRPGGREKEGTSR